MFIYVKPCGVQYLTYISINVPSVNQFHSKTSELLSENKTLTLLWTPPARHTYQRQSISRNFSLKNPAKNDILYYDEQLGTQNVH